jgi:hypothetical protein
MVNANMAVRGKTLYKVILPGITPRQRVHWRNGYSAVNYQLKDKEATGGMFFRQESQVHGRGIHRRNGFPPVIPSSWTLIQVGKIKMQKRSSKRKQFQDQIAPNFSLPRMSTFL